MTAIRKPRTAEHNAAIAEGCKRSAAKTRKKPQELEHKEQCALIKWAKASRQSIPELHLLFAIPNGGKRHIRVAAKLKAEGVKAGVPDLFLPVPRKGKHGLFIEMKSAAGAVSESQEIMIEDLQNQDYQATVCHSWTAAADVIKEYLK